MRCLAFRNGAKQSVSYNVTVISSQSLFSRADYTVLYTYYTHNIYELRSSAVIGVSYHATEKLPH